MPGDSPRADATSQHKSQRRQRRRGTGGGRAHGLVRGKSLFDVAWGGYLYLCEQQQRAGMQRDLTLIARDGQDMLFLQNFRRFFRSSDSTLSCVRSAFFFTLFLLPFRQSNSPAPDPGIPTAGHLFRHPVAVYFFGAACGPRGQGFAAELDGHLQPALGRIRRHGTSIAFDRINKLFLF